MLKMGHPEEGFVRAFSLIARLDPELVDIILLSLRVSLTALLLASALAVPLAITLFASTSRFKGISLSLLNTFMGLPPVVVGLFLYLILSRSGPLGFMGLLYTPSAMIAAQTILALPIVSSLSHASMVAVDPIIGQAAMTLGATRLQSLLTIMREARYGIMAGIIAGLGRVVAEVGAVLIVGGNIAGHTRVMTTTIALEADRGNFELALALGIILLSLSLIINMVLHYFQKRASG